MMEMHQNQVLQLKKYGNCQIGIVAVIEKTYGWV